MEASLPTLEREVDVCSALSQASAGLEEYPICDPVLLALSEMGAAPQISAVPHPIALDRVPGRSWQSFPCVPGPL